MAANFKPVFPLTAQIPVGQTLITANAAKDGTGTVSTLFTAGINGSKIDGVNVAYTGTTVATVLRLFVNNGSSTAVATNNTLIKSINVPANTMTSEVSTAADFFTTALNSGSIMLPGGYKITATIAISVATALSVTATGGDL